jgi:hypothetical protein
MTEDGGGHRNSFMVTNTQITPPHHRYADITICSLRRLPASLIVDSERSLAARFAKTLASGAPQCGQAATVLGTLLLHSRH